VRRPLDHSWTTISAVTLRTLAWNANSTTLRATRARRSRVENAGIQWQLMSTSGDLSEMTTSSNYYGPAGTLKLNRVNEIAGLMGSAGEQLCLAWTAEQDAQRWRQGGRGIKAIQQRMAIRAYSEMAAYFCLGAANSLANIGLQVMILDERLVAPMGKKFAHFDPSVYKVGSDSRKDWLTFSKELLEALKKAADVAQSDRCLGQHHSSTTARARCLKLVSVLADLHADSRFAALDNRRGMDYHRHRPQSLPTSSPRSGAWVEGDGIRSIDGGGVRPDPFHDEREIHQIAVQGMEAVTTAMNRARPLIVGAAAALGYVLVSHEA